MALNSESFLKRTISNIFNELRGKGKVEKDSTKSYLIQGTTSSLIFKISEIGLSFITSIILARLLGPNGLGEYSYVLAIVYLLVIPMQLGLPQLLVREIAIYKTNEKWNYLKGIILRADQFVLAAAIVLLIISITFLTFYTGFLKDSLKETFWWALPLIILIPFVANRSASLRGLKEVILGLIPELIIKPVALLLMIGIIMVTLGGSWFSPPKIMMLVSGSFIIALITGTIWLRKKLPIQIRYLTPGFDSRRWFKRSLPFMLMGGLAIINSKIDLVLLGSLGSKDQVGLYLIANKGANLVSISLTAVNMATAPLFASLWVKQDLDQLQKILTRSTLAIFAFSIPVAMVMILMGHWILDLFWGNEFTNAATPLAILSIGYLFNATMGSVGSILNMTGNERFTSIGMGISVIINILLNLWLIPKLGMNGAAIASLVSFVVWNTFLGYIVYKKLNLLPSLLYLIKR